MEEYSEELDPEPSMADRAALAQEMASKGVHAAYDAARDPEKRKAAAQAAVGGAASAASAAVAGASSLMGFGKKPS